MMNRHRFQHCIIAKQATIYHRHRWWLDSITNFRVTELVQDKRRLFIYTMTYRLVGAKRCNSIASFLHQPIDMFYNPGLAYTIPCSKEMDDLYIDFEGQFNGMSHITWYLLYTFDLFRILNAVLCEAAIKLSTRISICDFLYGNP